MNHHAHIQHPYSVMYARIWIFFCRNSNSVTFTFYTTRETGFQCVYNIHSRHSWAENTHLCLKTCQLLICEEHWCIISKLMSYSDFELIFGRACVLSIPYDWLQMQNPKYKSQVSNLKLLFDNNNMFLESLKLTSLLLSEFLSVLSLSSSSS